MAYATGTSSGAVDIAQKLVTFCQALGWTVLKLEAVNVTSLWAVIGNVAQLVNIYADGDSIYFSHITLFDNTKDRENQPGKSQWTRCVLGGSAYPSYFFFGDGAQFIGVVERSTGVFRTFGFGTLEKAGSYTGGQFLTGTNYESPIGETNWNSAAFDYYGGIYTSHFCTQARVAVDGKTDFYSQTNNMGDGVTYPRLMTTARGGIEQDITTRTPNTFNALTPLAPIRMAVERSNSGLYSPIGTVRDVRVVNMKLLSPKEEIVLGSDTWKVFPMSSKVPWVGYPQTNFGSGDYGFAMRKVVD